MGLLPLHCTLLLHLFMPLYLHSSYHDPIRKMQYCIHLTNPAIASAKKGWGRSRSVNKPEKKCKRSVTLFHTSIFWSVKPGPISDKPVATSGRPGIYPCVVVVYQIWPQSHLKCSRHQHVTVLLERPINKYSDNVTNNKQMNRFNWYLITTKHVTRNHPSLICYLHFSVYHETSWKNLKVIETFLSAPVLMHGGHMTIAYGTILQNFMKNHDLSRFAS